MRVQRRRGGDEQGDEWNRHADGDAGEFAGACSGARVKRAGALALLVSSTSCPACQRIAKG